MLLGRSFRRRGKDVHLREITDLIAVRSTEEEQKPENTNHATPDRHAPPAALSRLNSQTFDVLAHEVSLPEVRSFEDGGWVFVLRHDSESLPPGVHRAKVFIKPGGRLALSTDRLDIKFKDDPDERQANEILQRYGCRVVDKLSFAPGLFRVEVTDPTQGDVLDVANALAASDAFEFAEPELIEAFTGR